MDNLLRNLLRAHTFQTHPQPLAAQHHSCESRHCPLLLAGSCLAGEPVTPFLYPSPGEGVVLSCCALPSTLHWSSAIPPPASSECVLYFSQGAVVKILNAWFLLITQACCPIKQIDVVLVILLESSAAVCILSPTLHCFLFTFQNTYLEMCMQHKN